MAGHAPHSRRLKHTSRALVVIMFKQRIGVSDLLGEFEPGASVEALGEPAIDRVEKIAGLIPLACSCC